MNLLLVPVPVFNRSKNVEAYLFRYRLPGGEKATADQDVSPLLQALNAGGVDAFAGLKALFVPITGAVLMAELDRQCRQPPERIIFLLEDRIPGNEAHLSVIASLQGKGYRFAASVNPQANQPNFVLKAMDYLFLGRDATGSPGRADTIRQYKRWFPSVRLVAAGVDTEQAFDRLLDDQIDYLEGSFFCKTDDIAGEKDIRPLKANLIHLLNMVRDENFEFDTIAGIVQRDPALSVSLMRFINSPYIGVRNKIKTIKHAVTVLGQEEVRKWVAAAVFRTLGAERPTELVRLSLVRARFAENLAPYFGLGPQSQSLFLMGMFSLLDLVLQATMSAALDTVSVSDEIRSALLQSGGPFEPVMRFLLSYEGADWDQVLDAAGRNTIAVDHIHDAYLNAISWYHELISDKVRPMRR